MKTKNLFLLAALAVSGILHAESVDIPVLYRMPSPTGLPSTAVHGFLIVVASLVMKRGL